METLGTSRSPSPPPFEVPLNRMETEGSNERVVTTRIPLNDTEGGNADDDNHMAGPEDLSLSYVDGAVAISAEVVEERDLQQEVQERIDNITIDAMLVVNMSSNEEEKNKAHSDSRRKSTATLQIVAAALIILIIVGGTIIGTRTLRPKPPATPMVTASPTTSISVFDFAISILAPLSGNEALLNESSPQYKSLWWMVHEDPANMMMTMMVSNETQFSSPSTLMMVMERYIMALLYFSTDGPNWMLPYDFLGNQSICDWGEPIKCSDEGSAVRLGLGRSVPLQNCVPCCPILTLRAQNSLKCVYLLFSSLFRSWREVENNLNGTLPSELYSLSSLEQLSMWGNSLQGTLSSYLGRLTRLTSLQLGENLLTGSFPESFSNLRKLEWLYMDYNALTGSVPTIPSMEIMGIAFNFLTGTILESASFTNLRVIVLDWNMISGSIPESMFSSSNWEVFAVWNNQISGSLSSNLGNLVELEYLDLSSNIMTGAIPSEIGLLKNLELLHLDSNGFNGTIASQIGSLTRLDQLRLQNNQLSGSVPIELSSLLSTKSIKLFANNLTGSLDDVFCQQPSVVLSKVDADCGGVDPQVECSCCTTCCDSSSGSCTINKEAVCLVEKSWHEHPNGREYHESAGTVCECTTTGTDDNATTTTLSCEDTQCKSCNRNETVCSVNEHYQYSYGQDTNWDNMKSTFQYVVGRNDTVTFETTRHPDALVSCKITVNGQVCNSCYSAYCKDWFLSVHVNCENVLGAGSLNLCDASGTNDVGPLAVFAFQEPAYLQGCPPRIVVE
jgi:Leucine-rich repeat (LRR) protein